MYDLGGTYRAYEPHETLAKLQPLIWDTFGISRVANITGLDNINIPTYTAIRPLSKLVTTSQGKGITHDLAKISAIMESIEGWHCETMLFCVPLAPPVRIFLTTTCHSVLSGTQSTIHF